MENLNSIEPNVDELMRKISAIEKKIMDKRTNIQVDIIYFFVTIVILVIFLLIVFTDLFNVFKVYIDKKKQINSNNITDDDNDYHQNFFNNQNELEKIEEHIYNKHRSQQDNLKYLVNWKKSNNLKNPSKIESQIDINSLDKEFDNYLYNDKVQGESFWKLLFMPPKYHKLINNEAIPYFQFQKSS